MTETYVDRKNQYSNYKFVIALALVTYPIILFVHLNLRSYAYDDAYIHFRIVNNFIQHGVPYFNLAEPIMASSSPGWTVFLFLIGGLTRLFLPGFSLPLLVSIINSILITLSALVYSVLFSKLSNNRPIKLALLLFFMVYISLIIQSSVGLMETVMALLLVGIAFYLLMNNSRYCLILFSISVFFRLELIILYVLVLFYVIAAKKFPVRDIVALSALGFIPFLVFDLYYFGTILPNTISAKSTLFSITRLDTVRLIVEHFFEDFSQLATILNINKGYGFIYTAYSLWIIISIFVLFVIQEAKLFKLRSYREIDIISIVILLWGVIVLIGYVLSHTLIFEWYKPLYTVPILLILSKAIMDSHHKKALFFVIILFGYIFTSHFSHLAEVYIAASIKPVQYREFERGARVRHYMQIGNYLSKQYPNASLMTSEIGGLGYAFPGYVIDGAGLVSPRALTYHPMSVPDERVAGNIGAIPIGFVEEMNPDIIVSYDIFVISFFDSKVAEKYARYKYPLFLEDDLQQLDADVFWGSKNLNIFIRKDFLKDHSDDDYHLVNYQD